MKIENNENERSIKIKDGAKYQYFLIKMSILFTILTSVSTLFTLSPYHLKMMGFIWVFIGISTTLMFLYILKRNSYEEKLKLEKIACLKEIDVFGRKRLSLQLTNGKVRNILTKKPSEISEIKKLFDKHIRKGKSEATL